MAVRRGLPGIAIACVLCAQAIDAREQTPAARARDAYSRAAELDAQGNHQAALSLLWEAAGLAPHDADIQNSLGEALERLGALDAAVDAYRAALAERPSFKKASNNLTLALVKGGKGPEAVVRAQALVAANPDDPDRYFTLGLAQSEQDVNEAIRSFHRALELNPRHTLARYNLALVLRRADRLNDAIDELQRAIAIEPRAEAQYTLGVIYWHRGDLDRAIAALRGAIATEPRYADAHFTLGAVLKTKQDWDAAAASLARAVELKPDLTAAHYTLAQVLESKGDAAGARRHLADAERLRRQTQVEQEAGVWTAVGSQKFASGDFVGALDCFRRATTVFDGYAPAHYQMGLVLDRLGQPDAARSAYTRAHQLNPSLLPPRHLP